MTTSTTQQGKQMEFQTVDYLVGEHFAVVLINGDESGLEASDEYSVSRFVEDLPGAGHWSISAEESEFARCEITGLMSMCVKAQWVYKESAE